MPIHSLRTDHSARVSLALALLLCLLTALLPNPALGQYHDDPGLDAYSRSWSASDEDNTAAIDHQRWQALLDRYLVTDTSDGIYRFDYVATSDADYQSLLGYLEQLQSIDPLDYSRAEQMAYWINLYNAQTVEVILREKPRRSIRSTGSGWLPNGPWDEQLMTVNRRPLSLDDIEHRILRPLWRDPRIHFAVNCASLGCPNLHPKVFSAATLEQQLQQAEQEFLSHPRAIRIENGKLILSKIFKWYREDFAQNETALLAWLAARAPEELARRLAEWNGPLRYRYDWRLNKTGN